MKKVKTNVLRILDQKKINYDVEEYEFDEKNITGHHGVKEDNDDNNQVFKTLVLKGVKDYLVCCIPITKEIDLKKLAKASNNKYVEMIPQKDLLSITGYLRGGCSPIGMKKKFITYYQKDILELELVKVSAGKRGMQVIIDPNDLIEVTQGIIVDVVRGE